MRTHENFLLSGSNRSTSKGESNSPSHCTSKVVRRYYNSIHCTLKVVPSYYNMSYKKIIFEVLKNKSYFLFKYFLISQYRNHTNKMCLKQCIKNRTGPVGRTGNRLGNRSGSIVESKMSLNRCEPIKTGVNR